MTTLTLELTDEQAQKWAQEAERLHITLEQLAVQSVEAWLASRRQHVSQSIKHVLKENEELYRRLA